MKLLKTFLLTLLLLPLAELRAEDVVVIVNPENPVSELTRSQVIDLYMGRMVVFPNEESALPLDLPANTTTRTAFYRQLVDRTIAEVNAYWARLLFTGRASPPRTMPDSATMLRTVGENRGAIGYIEKRLVNDSVKVIYQLE